MIIFRVDSSLQIGSGHVMRCLTFAENIKKKDPDIHFICRDLVGNLADFIQKQGYGVHLINPFSGNENRAPSDLFHYSWLEGCYQEDAAETLKIVHKLQGSDNQQKPHLIIDHYALDYAWQNIINSYVDKIIIIDDLADRKHDCDILIDQNYHPNQNRYADLIPKTAKTFLGPQYALLKHAFFTQTPRTKQHQTPQNLFIFFSGMDKTSETLKTLQALDRIDYHFKIVNVVCGSKNSDIADIKQICQKNHYHLHIDTPYMPNLIAQADMAIGAGGVNTWERCFQHVPTLVIAIADNQYDIAEQCHQAEFTYYIGKSQDIDVILLGNKISAFIDNGVIRRKIAQNLAISFKENKLYSIIETIYD